MMQAMPRRITPPAQSKPAALTRVKMRTAIARLKQRLRELQAFDPATVIDRDEPRIGALERAIDQALVRSFGAGTAGYRRYAAAQWLDRAGQRSGGTPPLKEIRAGLRQGKHASIALLEGLIARLQTSLE
jgi:hypothetical protein